MKKLMIIMIMLTGCAHPSDYSFVSTAKVVNGTDGVNGTNGSNGHSALVSVSPADATACSNGGSILNAGTDTNDNALLDPMEITSVAFVCNGQNGAVGATGSTGSQGQQGVAGQTGATGATGSTGNNGTNGTNGVNGTNGTNGTNAVLPQYMPVIAITPCGANSSSYKEVLLGLQGGSILSEFTGNASNAATVRNTLVPDGSYYDTDDSECNFSVSTTSNGNRTVSWNGTAANQSGTPYHAGSASYTASTGQWTVTY